MSEQSVSLIQALQVGAEIGMDFSIVDAGEFRRGLEVELEHGPHDPETDVTGGDVKKTGKIAWAHLKEMPDYYTRLDRMWILAEQEKLAQGALDKEVHFPVTARI
jgi:hypothetical protein